MPVITLTRVGLLMKFSLALLLSISLSTHAVFAQDINSLPESRAFAYRRQLTSGRVVVELTRETNGKTKDQLIEGFFDGDQYHSRFEMELDVTDSSGKTFRSRDLHKYVFTPTETLYYFDIKQSNGRTVAAYAHRFGDENKNYKEEIFKSSTGTYCFDPREIGIVPGGLATLKTFDIKQILVPEDFSTCTRSQIEVNGRKLERVEHSIANKRLKAVLLIDTDRGPSVVYSSLRSPGPRREEVIDTVESELLAYGAERLWFPSISVHTRTVDGKVVEKTTYKVTQADFNSKVDHKLFTLAGLDLPEGHSVIEMTSERNRKVSYWVNGKLVSDVPISSREN